METFRSYQDLKVWQKGMEIAAAVYKLTESFPRHEMYGLTGQMRRAAVSIPSNIAEGHARQSTREFLHHVSFAQGSTAELETQLLLCQQIGFSKEPDIKHILDLCNESGKMLRSLQRALQRHLDTKGA